MSKFKQPVELFKPRDHPSQLHQRREELQILELLERCTHVLRDDRIFLRQRVKELHPDVMAIFRRIRRCAPHAKLNQVEMHQLQVELRKYVVQERDKGRLERLAKWKEEFVFEPSAQQTLSRNASKSNMQFKPNKTDRRISNEPNSDLLNQLFGSHRGKSNGVPHKQTTLRSKPFEGRSLARSSSEQAGTFRLSNTFENALKSNEKVTSKQRHPSKGKENFAATKEVRINELMTEELSSPPQRREVLAPRTQQSLQQFSRSSKRAGIEASNGMSEVLRIKPPLKTSWSSHNILRQSEPSALQTGEEHRASNSRSNSRSNLNPPANDHSKQKILASARESINVADFSNQQFNSSLLSYRLSQNLLATGSRRQSYQLDATNVPLPIKPVAAFNNPIMNPISNWMTASTSVLGGTSSYFSNYVSTTTGFGGYRKSFTADDNLFTNPELLMECRMIIEQRNKKIQEIVDTITPVTPAFIHSTQLQYQNPSAIEPFRASENLVATSFSSSTLNLVDTVEVGESSGLVRETTQNFAHVSTINSSETFPTTTGYSFIETRTLTATEEIKSTELTHQIIVEEEEKHEVSMESPQRQQGLLHQLQPTLLSFEAQPAHNSPKQGADEDAKQESTNRIADDNLTPEMVFDSFFVATADPPTYIAFEKALQIASDYPLILPSLASLAPKKAALRPKLPTSATQHQLSALELGRLVESKYPTAQPNGAIRDIFNVIDINHKGHFTFEEYQQFLGQLLESESESLNTNPSSCEQLAQTAFRLFSMADLDSSKKVEYWGLYLSRNTPEFMRFSEYLQRFEFEIESD